MKERDCANCKHHTEDGCSSWDCEFEAKDLISRADAMGAVQDHFNANGFKGYDDGQKMMDRIKALPSAELTLETPQTYGKSINPSNAEVVEDYISRADAIELLTKIVFDEPPYLDSESLCRIYAKEQINTLPSAEIAETEPTVIRSKTLMPTKDFKEWAKRVRETNPNVIVIPCDAEVVSADAVQGWMPCSDRLPNESGEYLATIPLDADKTYVEVLTFHKGRFYEDDDEWGATYHDDVLAWMPLPTPYKGGDAE